MIRNSSNIKLVLDRAIAMEEQSHNIYIWAAEKASTSGAEKLLKELALEEREHKDKLLSLRKDKRKLSEFINSKDKITDLKIVDYLTDVKLSRDMSYQDILIYAGKREKDTFNYYTSLAEKLKGTNVQKLLKSLAEEELRHKRKIEELYDEEILKER